MKSEGWSQPTEREAERSIEASCGGKALATAAGGADSECEFPDRHFKIATATRAVPERGQGEATTP